MEDNSELLSSARLRTYSQTVSITDEDESNASIIQSLSHHNESASNLSISESIDSNHVVSQSDLDTEEDQLELDSLSSTNSIVVPKGQRQSFHGTGSNMESSSKKQNQQRSLSVSISNLQKHHAENSATSSQNVSIQDFFFNNPNRSKMTLSSVDDLQDGSNLSIAEEGNAPTRKPNIPYGNIPSTTFVKPKPQIRSSTPTPLVNEFTPKKDFMEPKLSSMRINRPQHSHLRNFKTSSILSLDQKLDSILKENESSASIVSNNNINDKTNSTSNIEDETSKNYTGLLNSEESNLLDMNNDFGKVSPYGGFSRPHLFVEDKQEFFSNAPWKVSKFDQCNGSLINSIELARKSGIVDGDLKWVGAVSMPSNIVPDHVKADISNELKENYDSSVVFLDDEVFEGHYKSFCKQILWPIFHYQIPDNPKSNAFENHSWKYYEKVNKIFAEKIAKEYKEGDVVWIHDYHLMLVPQMLRKLVPNAKIGFFLHISFPSSEVFRCLAQRKNILEGMLGADCITFQNEEYMAHFLQSSNRLLFADFNDVGVYYKDRVTVVSYNPIGIDFHHLHKQLKSNVVQNWRNLVSDRWQNKRLLLSRDKMDKIRGLKEKLLAYERFLNNHPEYVNDTILIIICSKSGTDDEDYENEVLSIVERINSKTEIISVDQPVILLNQDVEFEQYLALLAQADLFIVSTLREGMNLTCHEFICASQHLHSPLILSEFVGSASFLNDGPFISNPYNVKQVADQIYYALNMDEEEKYDRWDKIFQQILKNDAKTWVAKCMDDLSTAYNTLNLSQTDNLIKPLTEKLYNERMGIPKPLGKRLFVINLDELTGSLEIHGQTINSLQQQVIIKTLSNLTADKSNHVYVFSLFGRTELLRQYGRISDLGLIAENGGLIKLPFSNEWYSIVEEAEREWIPSVVQMVEAFCERIPGSYIEVEECSVAFHTESVSVSDKDYKDGLIGDIITHINELFSKEYNIHATLTKGILIVKEMNLISKSLALISDLSTDINKMKKLPSSGSVSSSPVSEIASPALSRSGSTISTLAISPIQISSNEVSAMSALNGFEHIFVCGGISRIDEELYSYFNNLSETGAIDSHHVTVVCVGQPGKFRTPASFSLKGINNLMTLLNKANTGTN